jgi:hypothetical protein
MVSARKKATEIRWAIPDSEVLRMLSEIATPLANIPEGDQAAWWRTLERWSRTAHPGRERYNPRKLSSAAMKIAAVVWREWPPQEE